MTGVAIRPWRDTDAPEMLTALLHRAFADLAARGLNFTGATQSVDLTRKRIARGVCFVAERAGVIVGTVTCEAPSAGGPSVMFAQPQTAGAHQLAVDPHAQRLGIGAALMDHAERWAREQAFRHLMIDTAWPAEHLVDWYRARRHAIVERVQWQGKGYRTVLMRKRVQPIATTSIRRARPDDAIAIARVQIATWRTTYSGIVPDTHLDAMSIDARSAWWQAQIDREQTPGASAAATHADTAVPPATFVADVDGETVGFVHAGAARPALGLDLAHWCGEIQALYVLADHRGLKLGERLLGAAREHLGRHGIERAFALVVNGNPAIDFYRRSGGVPLAHGTFELAGAMLGETAIGFDTGRTIARDH